ncbi:DUF3243 family protein [Pseudobacillus badius]|uniref:DUF3243 family protein n=1 Tax=Bacillus badius TaxID=1455 RepID=UPI0007B3526D|nr:DUF3243 family protein [Bacillus badius]KZR57440.1 hypothetical protein A3781_04550 [Bacillus badius]
MSVLENWNEWKNFLGDKLNQATSAGMNNDAVNNIAYQVGDYLASKVDPKNEQERVLSDFSIAPK